MFKNENGQTTRGEYDIDADGKFDNAITFDYDENGKMFPVNFEELN